MKVASDLFAWAGNDYLTCTDYHSNFFEVDQLTNTTSETIIAKLKNHFARYGSPNTLVTNNGPQYSLGQFKEFVNTWKIVHETSSPGNSQANGAAEAAVKVAKRLLRKCQASGEDMFIGLLNLRNTPTEGLESSPSQRLLGRRTRTLLLTTEARLKSDYINAERDAELKERKRLQIQGNSNGAREHSQNGTSGVW